MVIIIDSRKVIHILTNFFVQYNNIQKIINQIQHNVILHQANKISQLE